MDLWLKKMWPPSSTDCNPLDYFMWCVFEREVNKCTHITLSSLKVMTSDLMTDLDREFIIHAGKKFQPWIEAVKEATGVFIKQMCMLYAYKVFLKFSPKCIHPNYLFYCFECCPIVCPYLSSAPCIRRRETATLGKKAATSRWRCGLQKNSEEFNVRIVVC
jgi:hypothetical protein